VCRGGLRGPVGRLGEKEALSQATLNAATGEPVTKRRIYDVLRTDCYDKDPTVPWKNQTRLQRSALPDPVKEKRVEWATHLLALEHTVVWYHDNVIWADLCNTVVPRSAKKAAEQALARKGGRGWVSDDAREWGRNLKGSQECLKQNSWDTVRLWWVPILTRGKLHVEALPEGFPGETPEGAAIMTEKLPGVLARRFPNESKPKVLFTDRGRGFFNARNGNVTPKFKASLEQAGLRAFQGENALVQSGTIGDVLLHETAVSWLRYLMGQTTPAAPWTESREAYYTRLRAQCQKVNEKYDVDALCREFPSRLRDVVAKKGEKIGK